MTSAKFASMGSLHSGLSDGGVLLATDALHAGSWAGADDPRFDAWNDLGAGLGSGKRQKPLGEGHCVVLGCATDAEILRRGDALGWLDFHPHGGLGARIKRLLAEAMESMPTKGKPKRLGELVITSGVLALVVIDLPGKVPAKAMGSAAQSDKGVRYAGGTLVPVEPGTYSVEYEKLGRETDDGYFEGRTRIVRAR